VSGTCGCLKRASKSLKQERERRWMHVPPYIPLHRQRSVVVLVLVVEKEEKK
jgi:hypothetical protein